MNAWFNRLGFNRGIEFPELAEALRAELLSAAPDALGCWEQLGSGVLNFVCTRDVNHPGRHIAEAGTFIVAAWPGDHEPTLADLEAPK